MDNIAHWSAADREELFREAAFDEVIDEDPYMERSKTKQDRFNKAISDITRVYLKDTFLPAVGNLVADVCEVFQNSSVCICAIMAERTFWEKATILHQEAHRLKGKPQPPRYSRHYYDLAMMARSSAKAGALEDLALLRAVVEFKRKFYPSSWARYEFARPGTFRLVPPEHVHRTLERDYRAMRIMIFGEAPAFDKIMNDMKDLEEEINLQAQTTLQKGVAT